MRDVSEMSVVDLVNELATRVPTMVIGVHIPDDAGTCNSAFLMRGNKAACVGLAWGLSRECKRNFLQQET